MLGDDLRRLSSARAVAKKKTLIASEQDRPDVGEQRGAWRESQERIDPAEGFIAPLTVEGGVNGELFRAWVEQHLAPVLRPGDIVVMDNLSSHPQER